MSQDKIKVVGAKQHNLKNLTVEIPKNKITVITGLSGSGKSSLAFDTIYAEGQRRYVESLSTYARQFFGNLSKPEVDFIENLSPAISIDQKTVSSNPRSTVGTITEIYDYLRLLYAREGQPHCPDCGLEMSKLNKDELISEIESSVEEFKKVILTSDLVDKDQIKDSLNLKAVVKNKEIPISKVNQQKAKNTQLIVGRFDEKVSREQIESKLNSNSHIGLIYRLWSKEKKGRLNQIKIISNHYHCPKGHSSLQDLNPKLFSFNSPEGACSGCHGLGKKKVVDIDKLIPSPKLTLAEGAIHPWGRKMAGTSSLLKQVRQLGIDIDRPFKDLSDKDKKIILDGKDDYQGAIDNLEDRYLKTDSEHVRSQIEKYLVEKICPDCSGKRLNELVLNILVSDKSISELVSLDLAKLKDFFADYQSEKDYVNKIIEQINSRINFLIKVGLDYLNLDRSADSLAGGEAQRVRLATQLGSALAGVIYILDEPTIGLHPSDLKPLLKVVSNLKSDNSTVIMVEHDQETIVSADYIIDMGPGAGKNGGKIVAQGTPNQIKKANSLTGRYLRGEKKIEIPQRRRKTEKYLKIFGASHNNLKDIDLAIPLGRLVCISGVSGSGKSTLLYDILGRALSKHFHRSKAIPGDHRKITGIDHIDKVIKVDQSAIGRTPRSNPATYVGLFSLIRKEFAQVEFAQKRGYDSAQFSFNVKKGRCSKCSGQGQMKIEMYFMDDAYVPCPQCHGKRYNQETLEIKLKEEKNIAQILDLTVDEAREFFIDNPKIRRMLEVLQNVGLGYIRLGQPATTLSGGEAQRIKLAKELSRKSYNQTLYILDEPTTGLHVDDISKLLKVVGRLVDRGNSVIVIEHNLEVLKSADWIIDLGPGGGNKGGRVVAEGTPEEIAKCPQSLTGKFLKKVLK